jgi:RNA polymerase sigma factor for flagellar operon FliA
VTRAGETQQRWLDYRRTGDQELRNRLILTYSPLVRYLASRLSSGLSHVDADAIVSWGMDGLTGAIESYDPAQDAEFEKYALARIKAQVFDELRRRDWTT